MRLLVLLACPMLAAAQISVRAERIAGLIPSEWDPAAVIKPVALAFERNGNLLFADSQNNRVWRLRPDGALATVIRGADHGLKSIAGLAPDSRGNLYLSDYRLGEPGRVLRIGADGRLSAIYASERSSSAGIAVDASDNLYIADPFANVVWKRGQEGALQRVAGNGTYGTEGERGLAVTASLQMPRRLAFDARGNLLIADSRLLRVNPDGTLVRLAGNSLSPAGLAGAADGRVYIASSGQVLRWDPSGAVTPLAGVFDFRFSDGCARSGGLRLARNADVFASDVAVDAAGRVYVADSHHRRLRRIELNGEIRTVAGSGDRPRDPEVLYEPRGLAVDEAGNVYFAEFPANRVRQITSTGELRTLVGLDSPPPAEDPACYPGGPDVLSAPRGIALDARGNLYVADTGNNRIRRSPDGAVTTIAGVVKPRAIAVDAQGNVYFGQEGPGLSRIGVDGAIQPVQSPPGVVNGLAFTPDGRLFASFDRRLFVAGPDGLFVPVGAPNDSEGPIAVDSAGSVYLAGGYYGLVSRVTPGCNRAQVTGNWSWPMGVAGDGRGNLYVSDSHAIWRFAAIPLTGAEVPSPLIDKAGVRNAASDLAAREFFRSVPAGFWVEVNDAIAPGEILRIRGGCMGPLEPLEAQLLNGRLATNLEGTRVVIDGVAAPLFRVQSAEILAVVPRAVDGRTEVPLTVEYKGGSTSTRLKVAAAVPGIFVPALNQDMTLNTPANSAPIGSVVALFLTGTGLTEPPLEDGAFPGELLPRLRWPVAVWLGDPWLGEPETPAEVLYAGAAPGLVGVAQVDIRVPPIAARRTVQIRVNVSVNGIRRNQAVTLAVTTPLLP